MKPAHASILASRRVREALERAEVEYNYLASPDGTVAVQIEDLRSVIDQMDMMRDTLALGQMAWRGNWYGSPPFKGSSIVTERGDVVAYLGGDEETHREVGKVVAAHNAAITVKGESA